MVFSAAGGGGPSDGLIERTRWWAAWSSDTLSNVRLGSFYECIMHNFNVNAFNIH